MAVIRTGAKATKTKKNKGLYCHFPSLPSSRRVTPQGEAKEKSLLPSTGAAPTMPLEASAQLLPVS